MRKLVNFHFWILPILMMVILSFPMTPPTSGQTANISITEDSIYFWKTDLNRFPISDANIFPKVSFDGDLDNLGEAWITWKINVSEGFVGLHTTYNQGQRTQIVTDNIVYDEILWFGVQTNLLRIGVNENNTNLKVYLENGQTLSQTIIGRTVDHQVFVSDGSFFMFANNTSTNELTYYSFENQVQLVSMSTNEFVEAAGLGAAVIQQPGGNRVFYTGSQNITIPNTVSGNITIGHYQLVPVVFDIDNQRMWIPELNQFIKFPTTDLFTAVGYYGLQSSIIIGNERLYERGVNGTWNIIGEFTPTPFDYAIVDIGMYLGPVLKSGLGLYTSGFDQDEDKIPDTMEDYFGSLSTMGDTDGDGLSDGDEIVFGTDPTRVDNNEDYDNDYLTNEDEIKNNLDPNNPDSDYGGALDGWEIRYEYNASNPVDDEYDEDNDGVSNALESQWNSNPRSPDTDGDGLPDAWEIAYGINPNRANADEDPDGDTKTNYEEYLEGTDPLVQNRRPLYEGAYMELMAIFIISLPVASIMWIYYPRMKNDDETNL